MSTQDFDRLAAGLVRSRQGPFHRFEQSDIKSFLLGCKAKAIYLLRRHSGRILSVDSDDLVSIAISKISEHYGGDDVPELSNLRALGYRIIGNHLFSLLRKKTNLRALPDASSDFDDGGADTDEEKYNRLAGTTSGYLEDDPTDAIAAKQKMAELDRRIAQNDAEYGPEFRDLVKTLLTEDGSAAIYGVDGFDRKHIHDVRERQGRSPISDTQLERYIKYIRFGVEALIADSDYQRSDRPKASSVMEQPVVPGACNSAPEVEVSAKPDSTV